MLIRYVYDIRGTLFEYLINTKEMGTTAFSFTGLLEFILPKILKKLKNYKNYTDEILSIYLQIPQLIQDAITNNKNKYIRRINGKENRYYIKLEITEDKKEYYIKGYVKLIGHSTRMYNFYIFASNSLKVKEYINRNQFHFLKQLIPEDYYEIELPYIIYSDNFGNIIIGIIVY